MLGQPHLGDWRGGTEAARIESGLVKIDESVRNARSSGKFQNSQNRSAAFRTFPSAISRNATTTSRLSDSINGFAPLKSCLARLDASITSSNRLVTFCKQSSTVMRDMKPPQKTRRFNQISLRESTHIRQKITCQWADGEEKIGSEAGGLIFLKRFLMLYLFAGSGFCECHI